MSSLKRHKDKNRQQQINKNKNKYTIATTKKKLEHHFI